MLIAQSPRVELQGQGTDHVERGKEPPPAFPDGHFLVCPQQWSEKDRQVHLSLKGGTGLIPGLS